MTEEYDGVHVIFVNGCDAIIHFDTAKYDVQEEIVRQYIGTQRHLHDCTLYGQLSLLNVGRIVVSVNPAMREVVDLGKIVKALIEGIILPAKTLL